jgi:hypothetical protein
MSHENITLVVLSVVLCSLNVLLGPLSLRIARLFGKRSTDTAREQEDALAETTDAPAVSGAAVAQRAAR